MSSLDINLSSIKTLKNADTPVKVIRKHAEGCLNEKNSHLLFIFVDQIQGWSSKYNNN